MSGSATGLFSETPRHRVPRDWSSHYPLQVPSPTLDSLSTMKMLPGRAQSESPSNRLGMLTLSSPAHSPVLELIKNKFSVTRVGFSESVSEYVVSPFSDRRESLGLEPHSPKPLPVRHHYKPIGRSSCLNIAPEMLSFDPSSSNMFSRRIRHDAGQNNSMEL